MPSLREIMLNRAKEPAKARAQLCQRCHPSNLLCSSCLFSHWVQHLFQLQHIMYRFSPCKTAQEHSYLLLNEKTSTHYVSICFTMSAELRPLQICSIRFLDRFIPWTGRRQLHWQLLTLQGQQRQRGRRRGMAMDALHGQKPGDGMFQK